MPPGQPALPTAALLGCVLGRGKAARSIYQFLVAFRPATTKSLCQRDWKPFGRDALPGTHCWEQAETPALGNWRTATPRAQYLIYVSCTPPAQLLDSKAFKLCSFLDQTGLSWASQLPSPSSITPEHPARAIPGAPGSHTCCPVQSLAGTAVFWQLEAPLSLAGSRKQRMISSPCKRNSLCPGGLTVQILRCYPIETAAVKEAEVLQAPVTQQAMLFLWYMRQQEHHATW